MNNELNVTKDEVSETTKFRKAEHLRTEEILDINESDIDDEELETMMDDDSDETTPSHLTRVGKTSNPNKLAYHIVRCIQEFQIAELQSIGPVALSKAMMAIVRAESIITQYTTCEKLIVIPCIRKPKMRNGDERTAIRLRVMPVHIMHLH